MKFGIKFYKLDDDAKLEKNNSGLARNDMIVGKPTWTRRKCIITEGYFSSTT